MKVDREKDERAIALVVKCTDTRICNIMIRSCIVSCCCRFYLVIFWVNFVRNRISRLYEKT